MSMGDTGKVDFKEEVTSPTEVVVEESKTVEDVIKEKENELKQKQEEEIVKARAEELEKKAEAFFGYREEKKEEVKASPEAKTDEATISEEDRQLIEKARQAIEASKRVTQFYEQKNTILLEENKALKTDVLEKDIENKALRSKIEEMSNDHASKINTLIETDDQRLRYWANIRNRRKTNPEDTTLKAKEVEYLVDELSIHTPHLTPEDIRKFIAKKEEETIDVMPSVKSDYMSEAKRIASTVTEEKKKNDVLKAIAPRKINYDKY